MKHVYRLLTFVTWILAATSCSKEAGQVTSPESMVLGCDSLRLGNDAQTEITLELTTDQAWVLDSVLPATGSEAVDWLTVYDQEGSGNATIKLSCKQNENPADRLALVRFKIQGAYAEYRTCTLTQTGTPVVTTGTIAGATAESLTFSGSYVYTGEYVTKAGFEIWTAATIDTPQSIYCETPGSEFTAVCPVEYGNDYSYKAFVEGQDGKRFLATNTENVSVRFSLGEPKVEGELRTNVETKDAFVVVPYYFGDGKSYTVSGNCNIEGLTIGSTSVVFDPNGGEVRLPVTGTPATTGTATFTLTGLPNTSEPVTISIEVLEGGKGLVLFLETFGPTPSETKPFNLTNGLPIGVIPDNIVQFSRTGQPLAEYVRDTEYTNIRHETGMFSKPTHYEWASGSPCIQAQQGKQGIFTINHLNIEGASNIKFDFGYRCGSSFNKNDIVIEYSNDGGETWTQVAWETIGNYTIGKYIIIQTTEEIVGSTDLSLRLTLGNPTLSIDARIDDLRLTGDRL